MLYSDYELYVSYIWSKLRLRILSIILYKLSCINFNVKYNAFLFRYVSYIVVGPVLKHVINKVKNKEW